MALIEGLPQPVKQVIETVATKLKGNGGSRTLRAASTEPAKHLPIPSYPNSQQPWSAGENGYFVGNNN